MSKTHKVALVFSGGPAPAANAVISSAALSFLDNEIPVLGILDGFTRVQEFKPGTSEDLREGRDFIAIDKTISSIRNQSGIFIRSARANPGKPVGDKGDLRDPGKTEKLKNVIAAMEHLGVTALVTMGGDDTLKTANFLHMLGLPVIHIPKTIDNDYYGIPWTFGYWTAVDVAQKILLNLKSDAESTNAYFMVELMGRKAGWITYAAGIAGEAADMLAAEEVEGELDPEALAGHFADLIQAREAEGRTAGIICIAEGLADRLPDSLRPKELDQHGNVYYGRAELCKTLAEKTAAIYKERTGKAKKITPKQIGYETRTARPISYDVVLGSALGHGAYRLFSRNLFGHMVSVEDNMDIKAIPFSDLVDAETLVTKVRLVPKSGDLYKLKQALSFPVGSKD